ncbi:histone H2B.3 [Grus japonensis]|uniref:Histone H2B.3 n=1 Tax=Grus japonensis TaxID=30415 RepID=A0ABC9XWW0_GRUJA
MVSARGRKRRTQQGRRSQKERKSQHGRRQKSRGRRSPAKQRKHRGQAKHQRVEKQRKRALKRSFRSINAEMLNQIKRDSRFLSHQAEGLMIKFVENIYQQVLSEAERLRRKSRDPLISPAHVQAALQRVMPKRRWRQMPTVLLRNRH